MDSEGVHVKNMFGLLGGPSKPPRRRRRRSRASSKAGSSSMAATKTLNMQEELARKAATALLKDCGLSSENEWTLVSHSRDKQLSQKKERQQENQNFNSNTAVQSDRVDMDIVEKKNKEEEDFVVSKKAKPADRQVQMKMTQKQGTVLPIQKANPVHSEETQLLIKELEDAADKWELTSPEGLHQLMLWIQMLRSSSEGLQDDCGDASFFHAFVRSRVIRVIIEGILSEPVDLTFETRQEVMRLFDICLLGSSSDHEWLYRTLRTVATTAKNSSNQAKLLEMVTLAVDSMKKTNPSDSVSPLDESAGSNADWRLENLVLESEGRESLESLSDRSSKLLSSLRILALKSGYCQQQRSEEVSTLSEWKLAFHIINKEIELMSCESEAEIKLTVQRKHVIEQQLESRTSNDRSEMAKLKVSVSQLNERKSHLHQQKIQLLKQLEAVESSISEVDAQASQGEALLIEHQEKISHANSGLKHDLDSAVSELRRKHENMTAVQFVQAFARGINHRLNPEEALSSVGEDKDSCKEFACCLERYMSVEKRRADFLDGRIKFCQRRMLTAAEENRQFESLGIKRTAVSGLEEQMRLAIETDQIMLRKVISTVDETLVRSRSLLKTGTIQLFRSVVELLQHPGFKIFFTIDTFLDHYRSLGGQLKPEKKDKATELFGRSCSHAGVSDFASVVSSIQEDEATSFMSLSSKDQDPDRTLTPKSQSSSVHMSLPPPSAPTPSPGRAPQASYSAAAAGRSVRRLKPPMRRSRMIQKTSPTTEERHNDR